MQNNLLTVTGLSKTFMTQSGPVYAVDDVSFTIPKGSIMGLVGESGSGKSTLGRAILRLIEPSSGSTLFDGQELNQLSNHSLRQLRQKMQMIFQDPASSINPRLRVKDVIAEGLVAHHIGNRQQRIDKVASLLEEVGLSPDAMHRFPYEFSGGQRQRIGIARALALDPDFIVADECVSALDVSIQAQILNLLQDIRDRRQLTILFITHDLSVVEYLCDLTAVMYLGKIMEIGRTQTLFSEPTHPYTQALLCAIPSPDPNAQKKRVYLTGDIPSPIDPPRGCVFHTRCQFSVESCASQVPVLEETGLARQTACLRLKEIL